MMLYFHIAFKNEAPTVGIITDLALVLNKSESHGEKYLFVFNGFRFLDSTGVFMDSEERLPIILGPSQWDSRTTRFIYMTSEEFHVTEGMYNAELLIFTDFNRKARYATSCKFEISADIL